MDAARTSAADIPSVDRLLNEPALTALRSEYGRSAVLDTLRAHLEQLRRALLAGAADPMALAPDTIATAVSERLAATARLQLRAVFNCSGTVLHTHLGRALLPNEAVEAVGMALTHPVNLELDLKGGRRGERDALVEERLCELTGAEAATVVNNDAAAVLLMLSALAARREVIISRGELVEIGGSFRLPDIMRQAGVKLREVGTTNRTHFADYAQALGSKTAMLLKVHTSNYVIHGFTASVAVSALAPLARTHGVPLAVDLGSGALIDLSRWGLPAEVTVRDVVALGADLVAFSGDKLLGGPQAGIIVGRAELIRKLRASPLKRALRVSKLVLAALEPVLALYRWPERLPERLTLLRQLLRPLEELQLQAQRLRPRIQSPLGADFEVLAAPMSSQIGSGALPQHELPSYGLLIGAAKPQRGSLTALERALRALPRPILGRVADQKLQLDLRCLDLADEEAFASQWALLPMARGNSRRSTEDS